MHFCVQATLEDNGVADNAILTLRQSDKPNTGIRKELKQLKSKVLA